MRETLCTLLVASFIADPIGAQDFPSPKPGTEHQILAKDVGTWDCKINMYLSGPEGEPVQFKGVESNALVSGDLYLKTEFTATMGEREFEGHSLMGYNFKSKEYEGTWVDNFTSVPVRMAGKWDADKKKLVVDGIVVDPSGRELKQRQVTTWVTDVEKKFEIFLIIDTGGQETAVLLMDMMAKKR